MPGRLFYCDHHAIPLPGGHKFPIDKYRLVRELLLEDGSFILEPAPLVPVELIKLVHQPQYVDQVLAGTLSAASIRRIGFPWSQGLVQRTLASVGGTVAAAEEAMQHGWGGNLAGGTHHAFRDEGSGFCVFNDIAIAIVDLRTRNRIQRAAVIDLDVHQGDGTAAIFADDPQVFTLSIHSKSNFPFHKQKSTLDVELPDGTKDPEYLAALDRALPRVFDFDPDIIFYQSGVDGLYADRLGKLSLTHQGLYERDLRVVTAARDREIPLVITQGGGYGEPIALTAKAHARTYRTAYEIFSKTAVHQIAAGKDGRNITDRPGFLP